MTSFYPFEPSFIAGCPPGDIKKFDTHVEIDSNFLHILDGRSLESDEREKKKGEEFDRITVDESELPGSLKASESTKERMLSLLESRREKILENRA